MEIKKLSAIPYGNAFVEIDEDNNCIYLWSYRTLVCKLENNWLTVNGLYSMTTRRHIGAFMREYCNSNYQMAKQLYNDGYRLDITTGEVQRVE
jgi:hypothetical protein